MKTESELLKSLEMHDRQIMKLNDEKKQALAEFKEEKDELEGARDAVLKSLDDLRTGTVPLPFEEE